MVRAGVRPDISERVLGHVIAGVEGTYDRHSYADEKRDALEKLAAMVERILNPLPSSVAMLATSCGCIVVSIKSLGNTAEFVKFERHTKKLLDHLRSAYKAGPKFRPFDADYLSLSLRGAASWYFQRKKFQQKTILPARRKERLRDLAKALGRARREADKAMQDDVGWGLFGGWCAEANITPASAEPSRIFAEIKEAAAGLATLEAAAIRAARDVHTKRGPPRGTGILSQGDILSLAALYGRNGGHTEYYSFLGTRRFAEFVREFLIAVSRGDDRYARGHCR